MVEWVKTKHLGVRFWKSDKRKFKGKPDQCYVIRYKRYGKTISETVGWQSGGITPDICSTIRGQIISNIKTAESYQGLAEKREIKEQKRQTKKAEKEAQRRENTPFRVLAEKYIEWSKAEKKSWKDDESRYKHHIAPVLGHLPIKDIEGFHVQSLKSVMKKKKNQRTKKPLSDTTIKHTIALLRQIFYKARSWKMYEGENPVREAAKDSEKFKKFLKGGDRERVRYLSREESETLLTGLKKRSQQLHDYCQLSLLTGMRMGEVFNLKWTDIDLNQNNIHIKNPKSGYSRHAYITPPLEEMFNRLKAEGGKGGYIFLDRNGKKLVNTSNVFSRVVEKLGFNKNVTDSRDKVVAHSLRHTFASWLTQQGEPIIIVQKLMGHRDLNMTLRYSHVSPSHEREAVERMVQVVPKPEKVIKLKKGRKIKKN